MKKIVIVGAAHGIGKELCQLALEKNFQVIALDLEADKIEINKNISPYSIDVSSKEEFKKFRFWYQSQFSEAPDLWINNAGIARVGSFEKISEEDFDRILDVNFKGTVYGTRAALTMMTPSPRGKKIINVASMNGVIPAPFMSAYAASKHAVVGFTRSMQLEMEYKKNAIQFILVLPGFVSTRMNHGHVGFELPKWFQDRMESPKSAALEIWKGMNSSQTEVVVTSNGKWMNRMHRLFPKTSARSARLLLAKDWREAFGLDPIERE